MLVQLAIRDLVLIEAASLDLEPGLTVLTGETGAGKSILLDGLGLALGERADAALVRTGAREASATARFDLPPGHPAEALLADHGLAFDEPGQLILRRSVRADGGSRAHVNDQPVSAGLLRQIGRLLVEVHGQHDERGLMNPRGHLALVDAYAGHAGLVAEVAEAHARWRASGEARAAAEAQAEADSRDRDWLAHAVAELQRLSPRAGEEAELAGLRAAMQKQARLAESLGAIDTQLAGSEGAPARLRAAARRLERLAEAEADPDLAEAVAAMDRALVELDSVAAALTRVGQRIDLSPADLDAAETRLFDLRALARKHRVTVDELPALAETLSARLAALEAGAAGLEALADAERAAHAALVRAADALSASRRAAAARLDHAVNAELPLLKLEAARFRTAFAAASLGPSGADQAQFEVATNAGQGFGPLTRIASGGELSRFVLALKVALAGQGSAATLVFDEIDRGMGGATASAIGARLARVAAGAQVLVVTHSPQVAAAGDQHVRIEKTDGRTRLSRLDPGARRDEIARMLSGAELTEAARAQADELLAAARAA